MNLHLPVVGLEVAHAQGVGDVGPGVDLPVVADLGVAAGPVVAVETAGIRNQGANQSPHGSQGQGQDPVQLTKIMEKMTTGGMMISFVVVVFFLYHLDFKHCCFHGEKNT